MLYLNGIAVGVIELKNSRVSIGDGIRQLLSNQRPEFNLWFFATVQIVFAGNEKTPIAIMGGREGQNVFVSPEGDVDPEAYLPAFVRRYPFAFATEPSGEKMIVCIDRGAPMISESKDP